LYLGYLFLIFFIFFFIFFFFYFFFLKAVGLLLKWEKFYWLQIFGFLLIVLGTFVYNEVIKVPFYSNYFFNLKEKLKFLSFKKNLLNEIKKDKKKFEKNKNNEIDKENKNIENENKNKNINGKENENNINIENKNNINGKKNEII
jgi:hypothetical protein